MPFNKQENLAEISRKYTIPYGTLYWWLNSGKIILPRDEELLKKLRKNKRRRYYLEEENKMNT
jgi:hypothetical protein